MRAIAGQQLGACRHRLGNAFLVLELHADSVETEEVGLVVRPFNRDVTNAAWLPGYKTCCSPTLPLSEIYAR
jgi:hypothetical protein